VIARTDLARRRSDAKKTGREKIPVEGADGGRNLILIYALLPAFQSGNSAIAPCLYGMVGLAVLSRPPAREKPASDENLELRRGPGFRFLSPS